MALNPLVLLQGQAPQFEPRSNALARVLALRGMQQQQQAQAMQMQGMQQAQADRQRIMAEQEQARAAAMQQRNALESYLGSLDPNAGPARPFSPAEALRFLPPDDVAKLQSMLNPVRKVARTIEGRGPDGRPVTMQFDEEGKPVGQAVPKWVAPQLVDRGDRREVFDPTAVAPGQAFTINQSPDSRASVGAQMANASATREVAAATRDAAQITADSKAAERRKTLMDQAGDVLDTVNEAKKIVGVTTTGVGGMAAGIPMTEARKLAGHITTIKANLGFDRLQQMRDMSPTGGALGQVAVQELQSLQATVAMLDQLQKPSDVRAALEKIERHYRRWQETLGGSTGGASGSWSPKPAAPAKPAATGWGIVKD